VERGTYVPTEIQAGLNPESSQQMELMDFPVIHWTEMIHSGPIIGREMSDIEVIRKKVKLLGYYV
jgi:hypothetical protein